jgi:hypothetical protein
MRVAYNADASVPFDDFTGLEPWVLEAASTTYAAPAESASSAPETDLLREEIRKVILEELKELTRQ